jgi:hypothetical protein
LSTKVSKAALKKCRNCNNSLPEEAAFCPACGQATHGEEDMLSFFKHFLNDYFTFDSKIFRSIRPLFAKPGFLTLEYLAGRRVSYIPPLRLFIFSSIIFFLLLSVLDQGEGVQVAGDEAYWDNFFESWLPKLFFLLSPLFALLLAFLFKKRHGSMLVHFLFSLHFHATLFSAGLLYLILSWLFAQFDLLFLNQILLASFGIFILTYLFRALSKVYALKFFPNFWRYLLLIVGYSLLIVVSALALLLLIQ